MLVMLTTAKLAWSVAIEVIAVCVQFNLFTGAIHS